MKNPIEKKLEELQNHWIKFRENPTHRLLCWLVHPDEFQMIELLFELEDSEFGIIPDLFIKFESPFSSISKYDVQLVQELENLVKSYNKGLKEEDRVFVKPNKETGSSSTENPLFFLHQLQSFVSDIKNIEGSAVAYLLPSKNEMPKAWESWIKNTLVEGIPKRTRIMLVAFSEELNEKKELKAPEFYKNLEKSFPEEVKIIRPNLDMSAVAQQLATAGDAGHPGVKLNAVFQAMSNIPSGNKLEDAERLKKRALSIVGSQKGEEWKAMEFTTYLLSGNLLLGEKNKTNAINNFDEAIRTAQNILAKGNKSGNTLLIQAQLAKGAALIASEDSKSAALVYQSAAQSAAQSKKTISQKIESLRMASKCFYDSKQYDLAWETGTECLQTLEEIINKADKKLQKPKYSKEKFANEKKR